MALRSVGVGTDEKKNTKAETYWLLMMGVGTDGGKNIKAGTHWFSMSR